jgi:hypothetical protein
MSARVATFVGLLSAAIVLAEAWPAEAKTIRCYRRGCLHTNVSSAPGAGKNCFAVPRGWHYDRNASGVNKTGIKRRSFYRCH